MDSEQLNRLVGQVILEVNRVLFKFKGEFDEDGPLELLLESGEAVLMDGDGDGETLRIRNTRWVDPFRGPLNEENKCYIESHGKWTCVEVSHQPYYRDFKGEVIICVETLSNEFGVEAGVSIETKTAKLWFTVMADEYWVTWSLPRGYRVERRYCL